jgi:hypothetical protein
MFMDDQVSELKLLCGSVDAFEDGGVTYLVLGGLALPPGCTPPSTDALLCSTPRDGYPSRLFFADRVQSPHERNWNFNGRIGERNWHAFSWKVNDARAMRLAQLVRVHLDGFRRAA